MSNNRQLAINMIASMVVMLANYGISFFLTPYIVGKISAAAYGFIGLSNNIISYSALLTVAINAFAGRFVTVSVHAGDYEKANKYLSSVFYANLVLSVILSATFIGVTIYLEHFIDIPKDIESDVKLLFLCLSLNTALGLLVGPISVSTYITNRLDLSQGRNLLGSVINLLVLGGLFIFFKPRVSYFGVAALVGLAYVFIANVILYKKLTPYLHISPRSVSLHHLMDVVKTGSWNLVIRLGGLLKRGFDLLFSNVFIGAAAMGTLSLTYMVPGVVVAILSSVVSNFSPILTRLFAQGKMEEFRHELLKYMRLTAFFMSIPLCGVIAMSDVFYSLWVPTQDSQMLYWLSMAGSLELLFVLSLEPVIPVFSIVNKVKWPALQGLAFSVLTFATVLLCALFLENKLHLLFVLAGTRSVYTALSYFLYFPYYTEICIGLSSRTTRLFTLKNIGLIAVMLVPAFLIKNICPDYTWWTFALVCLVIGLVLLPMAWFGFLNSNDRKYLMARVKEKLSRRAAVQTE